MGFLDNSNVYRIVTEPLPSWIKTRDRELTKLDCPQLKGTEYGMPRDCPLLSTLEDCQKACTSKVNGCNGINFRPFDSTQNFCCFHKCGDDSRPWYHQWTTGWDVWLYQAPYPWFQAAADDSGI